MQVNFLLVLLLSTVLGVVTSCGKTSTVYNVPEQSITANAAKLTEENVKKAILDAGTSLKWTMQADMPGNIVGTLYIRAHMAQVDIKYDLKKYSITYKNSSNLKYRTGNDGSFIHKNYNGWIQNLDRAIKLQLNTLQ